MAHYMFFEPHPDDATLSMGLAITTFTAGGGDTHVVGMSKGAVTPASIKLDGGAVCGYDGYTHNPTQEFYTVPTQDQIGDLRVSEGKSAAGAMAMIAPSPGVSPAGTVTYHEGIDGTGYLADLYGSQGTTTIPGLACTQEGVDAAQAVIKWYVDNYSNTYFYAMSPTDDHPDHAACGQALRNLKNDTVNICPSSGLTYAATLANARFFVSKLYWAGPGGSPPYPTDVAAQPDLQWFSAGSRKADYDAHLRNHVIRCFSAWDPNGGSFAIGYHQVVNQFLTCFGPTVTIANLWHA